MRHLHRCDQKNNVSHEGPCTCSCGATWPVGAKDWIYEQDRVVGKAVPEALFEDEYLGYKPQVVDTADVSDYAP